MLTRRLAILFMTAVATVTTTATMLLLLLLMMMMTMGQEFCIELFRTMLTVEHPSA